MNIITYLNSIPPLYVLIAIFAIFLFSSPIFSFPLQAIMIFAGYYFGGIYGGIINYVGLMVSSILGYHFGRWSSIDFDNIENKKVKKFVNLIDKYGISALLLIRIAPVLPNTVVSIGSGYAQLDQSKFLIISVIFIAPWAFIWSYVGDLFVGQFVQNLSLDLTYWHIIIPILVFGIFMIIKYHFNSSDH